VLANLQEDCAHRSSPFARQDNKQDNKQDSKPANQENNKSPGPIGRSADVCSAAIANGGSVHGDRVDAAVVAVAIPSAEFGR